MGVEIERKFLVSGDEWRAQVHLSERIRQGYVSRGPLASVRIRRIGLRAMVTLKGPGSLVRAEYEYEIPPEDADAMLEDLCSGPLIEKTRYFLKHGGLLWSVDEFHNPRAGLVLAELELERPDQPFERPSWAERDVTGDPNYQNANLVR